MNRKRRRSIFFPQFFGILLHAVISKAIAATRPLIDFDLSANVLVECQQTFVFHAPITPPNTFQTPYILSDCTGPSSGASVSASLHREPRRSPRIKGRAMFVNSIPIEVVGDAYHIAANYLTRTVTAKAGYLPTVA